MTIEALSQFTSFMVGVYDIKGLRAAAKKSAHFTPDQLSCLTESASDQALNCANPAPLYYPDVDPAALQAVYCEALADNWTSCLT